jgi:hypothetical protein
MNLKDVYAVVDGLETVVVKYEARIAALEAQLEEAQSKPRGGKGSGKKWTDEQKANLKRAMQGRAHRWTDEERAALSATMKATFARKKALSELEGGSAEAPLSAEELAQAVYVSDDGDPSAGYEVAGRVISEEEFEAALQAQGQ